MKDLYAENHNILMKKKSNRTQINGKASHVPRF